MVAPPTLAELVEFDAREWRIVTITVENLDGLQTVEGQVWKRAMQGHLYAPSSLPDLAEVPPGEARSVDVEMGAHMWLSLRLKASGSGANILVSAVGEGGRRK